MSLAAGVVVEDVTVDSPGMQRLAAALARSYGVSLRIHRESPWRRRVVSRARAVVSPFRAAARLVFDWAVVRCMMRPPRFESVGPMVLLDTFVLPSAIESDRYYPGLFDYLDEPEQRTVRFVPQFHGFSPRAMIAAVGRLRARPSTYLLKESVLGLADIAWVIGYLVRIRGWRIGSMSLAGIDVGPLVDEDLRDARSFRCAMQGLINYRFARRIAAMGGRVRVAIDWFENHPMDRGWNAGFRRYFPAADLKGYQGFYPSFPAARPTAHERAAGVLPDEIVTIGESMLGDVKEFDATLSVSVGPAFRYRHIADASSVASASPQRILVVLPYDWSVGVYVLESIGAIDEQLKEFDWVLKPHPANDPRAFRNLRDRCLPRADISTVSLDCAASDCAVVVGGSVATSSLEVIAMGRPFVSVTAPGTAALHAAPSALDRDALVCVDNPEALAAAVRRLSDAVGAGGRVADIARRVKGGYFRPVDRAGVERLLSL